MLVGNTGVQMGGWFAKEVTGIESYKGLRYRMFADVHWVVDCRHDRCFLVDAAGSGRRR